MLSRLTFFFILLISQATNAQTAKKLPASKNIEVKYDKFSQLITVSTADAISLKKLQHCPDRISASLLGIGPKSSSPRISLSIYGSGKEILFMKPKKNLDLNLLIDGAERITLPCEDQDTSTMSSGGFFEVMRYNLSEEVLAKIVSAKKDRG